MSRRTLSFAVSAVALIAVFWVLTAPYSGRHMLKMMDRAYPVLTVDRCPEADAIAVLSGDGAPRGPEAVLATDPPSRSEAGLELYLAGRAKYLVFTDGGREGEQSRAAAVRSGIPEDRILVVATAHDTADEARLIAAAARQRHWQHVILVTSGYHMGRAKLLLESAAERTDTKLHVTAFPADSGKILLRSRPGMREFIPDESGFEKSSRVIRETTGQLACRLGIC